MKYNNLTLQPAISKKRVGRGIAAGQGKTAGRGTKGQKSRAGYSQRPGFEGGQNPLMQRLPKLRGFRSAKLKPELIYTDQLNQLSSKTVDASLLADKGLISSPHVNVKLLAKGDLTKQVALKLPAASVKAVTQVEKAGGSFTPTPRLIRPASSQAQSAADKQDVPKPTKA